MTKKKQRKGRANKEAKRKAAHEDPPRMMDNLKTAVTMNVQTQRTNEVLEPLYPLVTSLEITKAFPYHGELLEKINLQDYNERTEGSGDYGGHYAYSVAIKLQLKDFACLQTRISDTTIIGDSRIFFEAEDDASTVWVSIRQEGIHFNGTFQDESGEFIESLLEEGEKERPITPWDDTGKFDMMVDIHQVTLPSIMVAPARDCDLKSRLEGIDQMGRKFLEEMVQHAEDESLPASMREACHRGIPIFHRQMVLHGVARSAFHFFILLTDKQFCTFQLNWGETHYDDRGDVVSWHMELPSIPLRANLIGSMQFGLSGVPFATCPEPQIWFDGKHILAAYQKLVTVKFSLEEGLVKFLRTVHPKDWGKYWPDKLTLASIKIDARNEPGLKKRLEVLKAYKWAGGDLMTEKPDFLNTRLVNVLTKFSEVGCECGECDRVLPDP